MAKAKTKAETVVPFGKHKRDATIKDFLEMACSKEQAAAYREMLSAPAVLETVRAATEYLKQIMDLLITEEDFDDLDPADIPTLPPMDRNAPEFELIASLVEDIIDEAPRFYENYKDYGEKPARPLDEFMDELMGCATPLRLPLAMLEAAAKNPAKAATKKPAAKKPAAKTAAKKPAAKKKPAPPPAPTPPLQFTEEKKSEMLVAMAVYCRGVPFPLPDWAEGGTQFEKLYDFLKRLGRSGMDVPAADRCFAAWLKDEEVEISDYLEDEDEDEDDEDY